VQSSRQIVATNKPTPGFLRVEIENEIGNFIENVTIR